MAETVLYKDRALITQNSDSLFIFVQEQPSEKRSTRRDERKHGKWNKIHSFRQRGQLYNSGTNSQLFICNFDNIYSLRIDDENNFEPKKENLILNFMECGTMLSSDDGRVILTYK